MNRFEIVHGVVSLNISNDTIGFGIVIFNEPTITVDAYILNNNYVSNTMLNDSQQVNSEDIVGAGLRQIQRLLDRHSTDIKIEAVFKELSYETYFEESKKTVYLTRDFSRFRNKVYVNINNEKQLIFDLSEDNSSIYNQLIQKEKLS